MGDFGAVTKRVTELVVGYGRADPDKRIDPQSELLIFTPNRAAWAFYSIPSHRMVSSRVRICFGAERELMKSSPTPAGSDPVRILLLLLLIIPITQLLFPPYQLDTLSTSERSTSTPSGPPAPPPLL